MNEDVKQELIDKLNEADSKYEHFVGKGNFEEANYWDGRLGGILTVISSMGLCAFRGDDDRFESIC